MANRTKTKWSTISHRILDYIVQPSPAKGFELDAVVGNLLRMAKLADFEEGELKPVDTFHRVAAIRLSSALLGTQKPTQKQYDEALHMAMLADRYVARYGRGENDLQ